MKSKSCFNSIFSTFVNKNLLILLFFALVVLFFERDPKFFVPFWLLGYFIILIKNNIEASHNKKVELMENKCNLASIIELDLSSMNLAKKLQEKGLNGNITRDIIEHIPDNTRVKIENYTNGFVRVKTWKKFSLKNNDQFEKEIYNESDFWESSPERFLLWSVNFSDYVPEGDYFENEFLQFYYFHGFFRAFQIYLSGEKFGNVTCEPDFVPIEKNSKNKNILLSLDTRDIEELKKYEFSNEDQKLMESFRSHGGYRAYANWSSSCKRDDSAFTWTLRYFSFIEPKV